MTRVICAVLGIALLLVVWLSVMRTVFIPRRDSSRTARWCLWVIGTISGRIARHVPARASDSVMEFCAPIAVFVTAAMWLLMLIAASFLLAHGFGGADRFTALPLVDMSAPMTGAALAERLTSLLVFASFIVHLVRLTDAYSRRERLVGGLAARASTPPDADQILAEQLRGGSRDNLDALFETWLEWTADVHATHTGYPALVYYRSAGRLAWCQAAVIVLDTAALVQAIAPKWAPPHARALLDAGAVCLRELAEKVGVHLAAELNTVSLHGREERPFRDTVRMAVRAGLPEECCQQRAWLVFQQERTRYAPYAAQLIGRLLYDHSATWPQPIESTGTE